MSDGRRETVAERVFLVRAALGAGPREPLSLKAFAARLSSAAGRNYALSTVSEMETGARRVSIEDAEAIAAVDPLRRGPAWVAFGIEAPQLHAGQPLERLAPLIRELHRATAALIETAGVADGEAAARVQRVLQMHAARDLSEPSPNLITPEEAVRRGLIPPQMEPAAPASAKPAPRERKRA